MDGDETQVGDGGNERGRVLKAGKVFEEYKVIRLLGRGGMGEVYEVEHRDLGTRHALKLIHPDIVGRAGSGERFAREAKVMAQLKDDHIVHVDDFRQSGGRAWLRMELVKGESLADLIKEHSGALPEEQVKEILRQVLEGLSYAHGKGVVHRDLKPANILLEGDVSHGTEDTERGQENRSDPRGSVRERKVKIADFGLVRLAGEQWVQSQVQQSVTRSMTMGSAPTEVDSEASGGTSTKALLGTFAYMSPEQKRGEEADGRSDLYAVGLMAYQMLTGEESIGMKRPSDLVEGLDAAWDAWVMKATDSKPEDRFASAEAMSAEMPAMGRRQQKQERGSQSPPREKGKTAWAAWITGSVLLLSAAIAVTFWYSGNQEAGFRERSDVQEVSQSNSEATGSDTEWKEASSSSEEIRPEQPITRVEDPAFILQVRPADARALVWVGRHSEMRVDNKGRLELEDLSSGEHELIIKAPGFKTYAAQVIKTPGEDLVHTASLAELKGSLEVISTSGTEVVAISEHGRKVPLGTTDANGRFSVTNGLRLGTYSIELHKPQFAKEVVEGVSLLLNRTVNVERMLSPLPGELRVFSDPSGASVSLDGEDKGKTPLTIKDVPTEKSLAVQLELSGYRSAEKEIRLEAGEVRTVRFGTLALQSGNLLVELEKQNDISFLKEGEVTLNGKEQTGVMTEEGILYEGMELGTCTVRILHPDYEEFHAEVDIRDGETHRLVALHPKPCQLRIEAEPAGVQWQLEIDGDRLVGDKNVYFLPAEKKLSLKVVAFGYEAASREMVLPANGEERWSVNLEKWKSIEAGEDREVALPGGEGVELVWIEPGEFLMGSPSNESGRDDDERQHRVVLTRGYWLGKYEVTQGEWEALMGENPSRFKKGATLEKGGFFKREKILEEPTRDFPVERVSWNDAMDFCRKLTQRERAAGRLPEGLAYSLPTEAQWEYACRAGTQSPYAFGDDLGCSEANYGNSRWSSECEGSNPGRTVEVGSYDPNRWGLYDMHGNVWEWCADWYADSYPGGSVTDPSGPSSGSSRVYRGGSWRNGAQLCRSAYRNWFTPGNSRDYLGFRLALSSAR